MSDLAVRAVELGKRYRIGARQARYSTLRESVVDSLGRFFSKPAGLLTGKGRNKDSRVDSIWALRHVCLEIKRGEAIGIIGPNGAGKSTLLKILSRITEPTEGYVDLRGRVASLLEVGTGFHPELTGRENIFLNGAILGMRRAETVRKFDEIVAFAGVERFIDTAVKFYSSGMYLRLAFAVAAHLDPEILVVDEVLAVGDADFQRKCLGKMEEVARSGRTVLFVSHNMLAVRGLTTKAFWLTEGRLKLDGPSAEVVDRYLSQGMDQFAFDVEHARREWQGDMAVKFLRIQLVGHEDGRISMDGDISMDLTVRSTVDAKDLRFSFTIFSAIGTPVGSGFSTERFNLACGETATLRLTVPCPSLAPGRYYQGMGVGYGDASTGTREHDVVIGCPSYEIVPRDGLGKGVRMWGQAWGPIIIQGARLQRLELSPCGS